jgi:hypothetical protein
VLLDPSYLAFYLESAPLGICHALEVLEVASWRGRLVLAWPYKQISIGMLASRFLPIGNQLDPHS